MPFGQSLGSGHLFQQHFGHGAAQRSSQQELRNLRKLTTAAAAATAGVAGLHLYRTGRLPLLPQRSEVTPKGAAKPLLQIPRELAEVMCGAVGEIVQVAVLYPLDTIKVCVGRCTAARLHHMARWGSHYVSCCRWPPDKAQGPVGQVPNWGCFQNRHVPLSLAGGVGFLSCRQGFQPG